MYNTYGWEWTTIAALIAPRPLLFANSDDDRIFPMDGNRRIIDRLRRLYKLYDKPDLVDEYVSKGGHDYRPDLRVAVFQWINKHLKNDAGPVKDADFEPIPGADLRVFPEDKDIPADALNGKIDETFVPRAEVKLPKEGEFAAWKKGLDDRAARAAVPRIPGADSGGAGGDDLRQLAKELRGGPLRDGGDLTAMLLTNVPNGGGEEGPRLLVVLNPEDEEKGDAVPEWAKPYAGDNPVRLLSPRGGGAFAVDAKIPPNYVERAHALLGRTVDEGRVWDVAATCALPDRAGQGRAGWRVIGRGQAGVIAAYAALFEPSIQEVIAVDPPASHRDGPYFLGVLRVLDTPDALGMLAPTPLTLVGAKDKAFDRTEQIYKAAGAAEFIAMRSTSPSRSTGRVERLRASPRKKSVLFANQPPPAVRLSRCTTRVSRYEITGEPARGR